MYYHKGQAEIGVDEDKQKAYLEYTVGPRYARCYMYDICTSDDGISIANEDVLWVS